LEKGKDYFFVQILQRKKSIYFLVSYSANLLFKSREKISFPALPQNAMRQRIAPNYIFPGICHFIRECPGGTTRLFTYRGVLIIMKIMFVTGLFVVALLASTGIVSANLISNNGFETPDIGPGWQILYSVPGWTLDDGQIEYQLQNTVGLTPYEGRQYAELDPDYNVRISQVINVEGGKTYDITFAQSCRYDDPNLPSKLGVYLDNELLGQTSCTVATQNERSWVIHAYSFTPASDSAVKITFADEGTSDSYGVLLDDVNVEEGPTPVPEFPTFLTPVTLIAGFLAVVLIIRKNL
jgi:hypothetical protein